jgi:hypothetical protein
MIRGQKATEQSSTAKHSLGQRSIDTATGKQYIYGIANGAIASGKTCVFDHSTNKATDCMTAQNINGTLVKSCLAMTTAYYGWFEVKDPSKLLYENFVKGGVCFGVTNTGLPTGTAADVNGIITPDGNMFEYCVKGTQTILYPTWTIGTGLNFMFDATADDGAELTNGISSISRCAFTVGTSGAFHLRAKFSIADVSGTDDCAIGFRKAEAYQANLDDYDEMFGVNVISGNIYKTAILNGGATDDDDTTNNWADTEAHEIEIKVSAAGVCTILIDGAAPTSSGTAFTFDTGEVVVPFFFFLNDTDLVGAIQFTAWECGLD